jgi:hypothetical protein
MFVHAHFCHLRIEIWLTRGTNFILNIIPIQICDEFELVICVEIVNKFISIRLHILSISWVNTKNI